MRAGRCKALERLDGTTWMERTVASLRGAGAEAVFVVVAPPHGTAIARALAEAPVELVDNPRPELGMLESARCALRRMNDDSVVVIALVDHPRVEAETVRALVRAVSGRKGGPWAARPRCQGRTGHPIALDAEAWRLVRDDTDAQTLRDAIARAARWIEVETDDVGVLDDFDDGRAPQVRPPDSLKLVRG